VLLVVYWALTLPALGQEIAFLVQQYPMQRNVTLRLVEPLGAPEDDASTSSGAAPPAAVDSPVTSSVLAAGVAIRVGGAVVQAAGHVILTVDALAVAPGEQVAIVGPSGAGKSSLVGLLLGWHAVAPGALLVDGVAPVGEALEALRRQTVWVDPTVYLWNRSLTDNLTYGAAATSAAVAGAVADAELTEVVGRLSHGAATPLGEAGALVSGGEGQRVRFARGLVRPRPRLVILDEPFRGLARDQRQALLARARERWTGATLFCVTHDIDETRGFPRVLVVAEGRVVEDGAPATLLAQPGSRYAALLAAETRVREAAWSPDGAMSWRRVRLRGGRVAAPPGEGR
jgi:ABC-type multidrug transport system fused ATPase/permease subunit